jgi:hypothetical protein
LLKSTPASKSELASETGTGAGVSFALVALGSFVLVFDEGFLDPELLFFLDDILVI